jgi:hypothetical protein
VGEAVNAKGKTDMLVRYEGQNAFVGECKFWGGKKAYLETIDQLLGYLTWRDSKAAVLCFNQNREHEKVLQEIRESTAQHPCFVRPNKNTREGVFQFDFHLPGDEHRGVQLAVLCFHFPPGPA